MTESATPAAESAHKHVAKASIVFFDAVDEMGLSYLDIEFRSSNPNDGESVSNIMLGWMAANWPRHFADFKAELKEYVARFGQEEPASLVGTAPKLLGSDGRVISSEEHPQISDAGGM